MSLQRRFYPPAVLARYRRAKGVTSGRLPGLERCVLQSVAASCRKLAPLSQLPRQFQEPPECACHLHLIRSSTFRFKQHRRTHQNTQGPMGCGHWRRVWSSLCAGVTFKSASTSGLGGHHRSQLIQQCSCLADTDAGFSKSLL